MPERVERPEWKPFGSWDTRWKLGAVYEDEAGGPPLVRVLKVCDRLVDGKQVGCGAEYVGWQWQDKAPIARLAAVVVDETGRACQLCDYCLDAQERDERQREAAVRVSRRRPKMAELQAPEER